MISDEDIKRCVEIEYDCWKNNLAPMVNITEYLYFQTKVSLEIELKKLLSQNKTNIILSHQRVDPQSQGLTGTVITGFVVISYYQQHNRYVIEKLFVAPEYQNNHIAQNLLHAVINNFTDLPISMAVFKENRIMAHILIKYGFRQSYNRSLSLEYGKNKIDIPHSYYLLERNLDEEDIL